MIQYEYYCLECRTAYFSDVRANRLDGHCGTCDRETTWQRIWGVSHHKGVGEHWNHSLGKPIQNKRHLKSELSKASDEATARTGVEHRFVPIDLRDPAHKPPELQ